MAHLLKRKEYPANYSYAVRRVLNEMSLNGEKGIELVGSAGLRSQQFSGDFDAENKVVIESANEASKLFQKMIRRLLSDEDIVIGDIKCGVVEERRILPAKAGIKNGQIVGYNPAEVLAKVASADFIPKGEKEAIRRKVRADATPAQFLELRDMLKYHTIRWIPSEVLKGSQTIDGRTYSLAECLVSNSMTKVDAVAEIRDEFKEFGVVYRFFKDGKLVNDDGRDIKQSLTEDVIQLKAEGNEYKALKREFSLARATKQTDVVEKLNPILNSDLGIVYSVLSDVGTLIPLLESEAVSKKDVKEEIDGFNDRLANIYSVNPYLKQEGRVLRLIDSALSSGSAKGVATKLKEVEEVLRSVLSSGTRESLAQRGLSDK
jgi:hypothetical protein